MAHDYSLGIPDSSLGLLWDTPDSFPPLARYLVFILSFVFVVRFSTQAKFIAHYVRNHFVQRQIV